MFVRPVLRSVSRVSSRALRFAYRKLWREPSEVRGSLWALSLWLRVAGALVCVFKAPLAAALFAAGWAITKLQGMRPKQTTRPIPYRRYR